jgi:uncharacterized protein YdaU (DUF1376 family)
MRKPSAYFPLYGNDFFEAIAGYDDAVGMGYLRALWHYWHHTSCEGLPDDDEYLRRVCCVEGAHWARAKRIVFDNRYHFKLGEDGLWHQPRCKKEWDISTMLFEKKMKQTAAATAARMNRVQSIRNEERNGTRYVHQSPSPSPS